MRSLSFTLLLLEWASLLVGGLPFMIDPYQQKYLPYQHVRHHFRFKSAITGDLTASKHDSDETIDPFDMSQLQSRIEQQQNRYHDFILSANEMEHRPENVHIIVFNPETDEQGVHTIEFPQESGLNIILAFESQDDCETFATMLKDEGSRHFQNAVSAEAPLEELEDFCESTDMQVKVVPRGKDLRPPSDNVDELSFDPTLAMNHGKARGELEEENDDGDDAAQFMESWQ